MTRESLLRKWDLHVSVHELETREDCEAEMSHMSTICWAPLRGAFRQLLALPETRMAVGLCWVAISSHRAPLEVLTLRRLLNFSFVINPSSPSATSCTLAGRKCCRGPVGAKAGGDRAEARLTQCCMWRHRGCMDALHDDDDNTNNVYREQQSTLSRHSEAIHR